MVMKKFDLLHAYKEMLKIRRFEEKCSSIYMQKEIRGFCHLAIGQESIPVISKMNMKKGDAMITAYRCHGHMLACGTDPKYVLAELMQKETGVSKGKGGSMHLFDIPNEFYGGHGIVGAQVSLGTGIAFSKKYKNTDNVCIVFMGDGAFNQGQVYESFNMAKLWNLPVIYIIENNQYAMGTSIQRGCANADNLEQRAHGFGIQSQKVNAMDLYEFDSVIENAISYARQSGPILLNAITYRYKGHSMSDPATYRTKEELEQYKNRDVLLVAEEELIKQRLITQEEIKNMNKTLKNEMEEAYQFAKNSNMPSKDVLFDDIF